MQRSFEYPTAVCQFHVACKATIVSLILNLKMNKYAKISCSAHVEASKSIFFTVKPLFLFLENINMTRNDRKKKKSLPEGDSFGFLC